MRLFILIFSLLFTGYTQAQVVDFDTQPNWPTPTWPSEVATYTTNVAIVSGTCSGYFVEMSGGGSTAGEITFGPIAGVTTFSFDMVDVQPGNSGKVDVIEYDNSWNALVTQRYSLDSYTCPNTHTVTHVLQNSSTSYIGLKKATASSSVLRLDNVTSDGVLPVELTSFVAIDKETSILLKWNTATELHNFGFVVERFLEETDTWEELVTVLGHGASNSPKDYSFVDRDPKITRSTTIYYRLRQIDLDGTFSYSDIVKVSRRMSSANSIVPYPSPFQNTLQVTISVIETRPLLVEMYSTTGEKVKTIYKGESSNNLYMNINTTNIPSGLYFIVVSSNNQIILKAKVIKT